MNKQQLLQDLFRAYYDARKNKRNTKSALAFEINYETKLFELCDDLLNGKYKIGKSICFISFLPVKREIFAADFRDRIIHHLIFNYINPIFEKRFINDSYSCRRGKGTSYGIKRLDHFIRSGTENYQKDCWILKLDIKGYFMSIDKNILYEKIEATIKKTKDIDFESEFLLPLIRQVIFHDSTKNCIIKGERSDWLGLPKSKSLFFAGQDRGLPIGNLTSQLFGNIYLNGFDHFAKRKLKFKYYGRYVDDFVIVDDNKEYLKSVIPLLKEYLQSNLFLELHPKKIWLQHFSKGAKFLGVEIKSHRLYVSNRIKGNFCKKIKEWNKNLVGAKEILAGVNSYLGLMQNFRTYKLRRKIVEQEFMPRFGKLVFLAESIKEKFLASPDYKKIILEEI